MIYDFLIVGAGFAGSVLAERITSQLNKKVLIVDDDINLLNTFKVNLAGRFDLTTCNNAYEALRQIDTSDPFAVVISDYHMSGMDGITLLSFAKKICPYTIRIILAGYADKETATDATNRGEITRFLAKPYPILELIKILDECIDVFNKNRVLLES